MSTIPSPPSSDYPLLWRIILLGVSLILVTTLAYNIWDGYKDYQTIINAAEIQTRGYSRALKEHAERTFSEVDLILQATVRQIETAGGPFDSAQDRPGKPGQPALEQLLRKNAASAPQIGSLAFVDPAGKITVNSLEQTNRYPDVSDRPYFRFHQQNSADRLFINPPFKSKVIGKWRFTLSRRINTPSGRFAGIIVAAFEISYFEQLYATLTADRNARYSLATIPGDYLVLVPNAQQVYETRKQTNSAFRQKVAVASAQTYHVQRSNVFGETRIVSYHCLERYPVVAIMSFDKKDVLAAWRSNTFKTGLTTAIIMLLVISLTIQLLKQVKLLDQKVQERTALLSLANRFLEQEIEERKDVETNLINHQNKLDQMAGELALAEDRERGRIAGELHDQVGQCLILCKIKLDELSNEAGCQNSVQTISKIEALVDKSLTDIRSLTFQLRPPILASVGLFAALQWLSEELQRDYKLEVTFDECYYGDHSKKLRYEICSTLFQIVRELLLNVVKHAGVSVAWVSLQQTDELLLIKVIDNGKGFDTAAEPAASSRQGGFGMYNLQRKLEFLGGSSLIESSPGTGAFITISLPLKPDFFEET